MIMSECVRIMTTYALCIELDLAKKELGFYLR